MLRKFEKKCIPRTVSKLEFRLRQSPGVRATQRGPYCINTDLFAIDRTAGAYRLSPNSNFLTARGIHKTHLWNHHLRMWIGNRDQTSQMSSRRELVCRDRAVETDRSAEGKITKCSDPL